MKLPTCWSPLRILVLLIAGAETVLAVVVLGYLLTSGVSEEAKSINQIVAGLFATLYAMSGAPALALVLWGRWLWLALALAVVPVALAALRIVLY